MTHSPFKHSLFLFLLLGTASAQGIDQEKDAAPIAAAANPPAATLREAAEPEAEKKTEDKTPPDIKLDAAQIPEPPEAPETIEGLSDESSNEAEEAEGAEETEQAAATSDQDSKMISEETIDMPAPVFGKQSGAAVFERLRKNFAGPVCQSSPAIESWKKRYAGNRKAFTNEIQRMLPLLDYVSSEVEKKKLPAEYALIPIVESRYLPHAIGAGGPAGLWQMIGSTAKNHGIKIQSGYDGRFSVIDSTDAALSYLKTLDGMFPDWKRSAMGYNAGEFRVLRAMKNSPKQNDDRWPHGLSHITYAYIAKLQALSCVLSRPKAYGLTLPNSVQFTPLSSVTVQQNDRHLETIAKRMNIELAQIKSLNPAYKNGQIDEATPRRVLLPKMHSDVDRSASDGPADNKAASIERSTANSADADSHSSTHRVSAGDTLWGISKRYGIGLSVLKKLNGLSANTVLRIGQQLKLSP
jgi:membrane-bound lytic murein transglycosylase D